MCKYKLVSLYTGQDFPHLFQDFVFLKYTRLIPDRIDERKVLGLVKTLSYLADIVLCM